MFQQGAAEFRRLSENIVKLSKPKGKLKTVPSIADTRKALDIIAARVPHLSVNATRMKAWKETRYLEKGVKRLCEEALGMPDLKPAERQFLLRMVENIEDDGMPFLLRVKISNEQADQLETEARENGISMSELVRRKLFGVKLTGGKVAHRGPPRQRSK